jgi:serine protease Do
VITEIAGRPVDGLAAFRLIIAEAAIGAPVTFRVVRGGRSRSLTVTLGERGDGVRILRERTAAAGGGEEWMGLEVVDLSSELRAELGLARGDRGVVVRSVRAGSPAEAAEVEAGSLVLEVGGRVIETLADFRSAVDGRDDTSAPIVLLIQRGGLTKFVAVGPGGSGATPWPAAPQGKPLDAGRRGP